MLAHEVSRRMTPGYAKERAKEMARYKAYEMRDRAAEKPWMLPLLGAGIGALLGKALTSRAQDRRDRYGWDERYAVPRAAYWRGGIRSGDGYGLRESERYEVWSGEDAGVAPLETEPYTGIDVEGSGGEPGLRDRADEARARAAEMKDRASEKVGEVKERLTGRASEVGDRVRTRAHDLRERIPDSHELRANAQENPAFWAFGAMAVGAAIGLVLPITEGERRALAPTREKLREAGQQAAQKVSDQVSEKLGTTGEGPRDELSGGIGIGSPAPMTPGGSSPGTRGEDLLPSEPLH